MNIKIVNNDIGKNYIDGFELEEFKLAFRNVFSKTSPYVAQGVVVFWLFILSSVGILFLILSNSLLNEEIFNSLTIYIPLVFGLGTAYLYYDSDKMPSSKVRRRFFIFMIQWV